jgi:hypothetical protein
MDWKILLAYITGTVDQELLLRNEYLVTENRLLRQQISGRVRLSDGERKALAEIGQKLGKKALEEIAHIVKPDTILAWHRQFIAQKFDGSRQRQAPGRPKIDEDLEALVVRMAQETARGAMTALSVPWPTWGIRFVIKRSAIFSSVMASSLPQSAKRPRPGRNLSVRTWMCSSPRTSSLPRSGP